MIPTPYRQPLVLKTYMNKEVSPNTWAQQSALELDNALRKLAFFSDQTLSNRRSLGLRKFGSLGGNMPAVRSPEL